MLRHLYRKSLSTLPACDPIHLLPPSLATSLLPSAIGSDRASSSSAMGGLQANSSGSRKPLDESPVYIVSAARTPLGAFGGSLAHLTATELGAIAIKGAVERAGVAPDQIEEVFMGNVCRCGRRRAVRREGCALGAS